MVSEAAPQYIDFEVPEELPETSGRIIGRVLAAGAQFPPEKRVAAQGGTPRAEFHLVVEPLNFKFDSDKTKFEDDYEHEWYPIYNKNGELQNANSKFGKVKAAFLKLGYPIRNMQDAQILVGKVFAFTKIKETIAFKKPDPNDPEKTIDDPRDIYTMVPVEEMPADYVHVGSVPVFKRPKVSASAPSAATVADNAAVALPILAEVLNGKTEDEYFTAITVTKDTNILRQPYITEASSDPHALTMRMISSGLMRQEGDRLVKVGS